MRRLLYIKSLAHGRAPPATAVGPGLNATGMGRVPGQARQALRRPGVGSDPIVLIQLLECRAQCIGK